MNETEQKLVRFTHWFGFRTLNIVWKPKLFDNQTIIDAPKSEHSHGTIHIWRHAELEIHWFLCHKWLFHTASFVVTKKCSILPLLAWRHLLMPPWRPQRFRNSNLKHICLIQSMLTTTKIETNFAFLHLNLPVVKRKSKFVKLSTKKKLSLSIFLSKTNKKLSC